MAHDAYVTRHPLSRLLHDDTLDHRLDTRVEQLRRHLVACSSCTTCESTALAWALGGLLDALRDSGSGVLWTAQDIRAVLGDSLL